MSVSRSLCDRGGDPRDAAGGLRSGYTMQTRRHQSSLHRGILIQLKIIVLLHCC